MGNKTYWIRRKSIEIVWAFVFRNEGKIWGNTRIIGDSACVKICFGWIQQVFYRVIIFIAGSDRHCMLAEVCWTNAMQTRFFSIFFFCNVMWCLHGHLLRSEWASVIYICNLKSKHKHNAMCNKNENEIWQQQ